MTVRSLAFAWTFSLLAACTCPETPAAAPAAAPTSDAAEAGNAAGEAAPAKAPTELSEEDKRLLAADPKSLTPEERRKRAYALRRKIMLNPDSPAARTLEDLRRAHESGQLPAPGSGLKFEARTADGKPPAGTMGPAGARPSEPTPTDAK